MNRREIIRLGLITPIAVMFKPKYESYIEVYQDGEGSVYPYKIYPFPMAKNIKLPPVPDIRIL